MKPKIMFVRVSENCNAGCFMCGFAHTHGKYNITDEQFDKLIKDMNEKETYEMIRFTGGEPLIHPHIIDFIKKSKDNGYETSIITNGYVLPSLAEQIAESKLDYIIISIDGSKSEIHDKLRGLPNGLERIKKGITKIRELNPNVKVRANTVVSDLNIDDLIDLYKMLDEYKFDAWSIIPIRPNDDPNTKWNENNLKHNLEKYKEFLEEQKNHTNIDLLGYSSNWAGTNDEEITNTFLNKFRVGPTDKCNLVDNVRFYIPDQELIVPCNCAAHRVHQIKTEYEKENNIYKKADIMAEWLKENGKDHCTGCEPLNAYAADNPKIFTKNLFKY